MTASIDHELGALQATVAAQSQVLARMQETIDALSRDVSEMRMIISAAKGSWKTLAILGVLSAAIGGMVVKLAAWFMGLPVPK